MAQLELANLLAANGAAAKPVTAGAGVGDSAPASAPAVSFGQWLQSDTLAQPETAGLSGAVSGDAARVAANPQTAQTLSTAAPVVDPGKIDAATLTVTLTEGAALTVGAEESGEVEEPSIEPDADEGSDAPGDELAAELSWLGLPLVMDARAALRPEDAAGADSAPAAETASVATGDSERLRSMLWSNSASTRLAGSGRAVLQSSGDLESDASIALVRSDAAVALTSEDAAGSASPSTGLDASLRPLKNGADAALQPAGAGELEPPDLAAASGLESPAPTVLEPEAAVTNPLEPESRLRPPQASGNPAPVAEGARGVLPPPLGAPTLDRRAEVAMAQANSQPAAAALSSVAADAALARAPATEPAPAAVEKAFVPRLIERSELQAATVATVAVAATRTENKARIDDRWPVARLLANQSLRWALERAGLTAPAEAERAPATQTAPAAAIQAPASATVSAATPALATAASASSPLLLAEIGELVRAPSPETDSGEDASPPEPVAVAKGSTTVDRSAASGHQTAAVTASTVFDKALPDRVDSRSSEPMPPVAGGALPQRPMTTPPGRPETSSTSFLPTAPEVVNLHQKHWERTLGQQLNWMVNNQLQEAEIKVNPPELGPLEVRVSLQHHQTNVTFFSHEAAVREALETALPRLRELLDAQGITLNQTQVADSSLARQQAGAGEQSAYGRRHDDRTPTAAPGAETAAETAEPRPRGRGLNGVVDDYA